MSEVKVNKITPTTNCGTVTLGDSGDTLSIPSGATLSNAGSITNSGTITNTGTISGGTITGTIDNQVNWDTTAKTANFTAVAGNGYFVNTTSAAITVTLPASPSAGDLVGIKDYANTADTNNITIDRNGSNIQGTANNFIISTEGRSILLIYVDATQGWLSTGASQASDITEDIKYVTATGGTVITCGDYKTHIFTGPGTFCVSCAGNPSGSATVDYMVVAGGSGGGKASSGGGGAGGFRLAVTTTPQSNPLNGSALPVSVTGYPIAVGSGGSGGSPGCSSSDVTKGSNSTFSTITSAAGGAGGGPCGSTGGSGAGGGAGGGTGAAGNTPPTSPPQGNPGGNGRCQSVPAGGAGGGGGGGGAAGVNSTPGSSNPAGAGGAGSYLPDAFIGPTAPSYGESGPVGSTRYFAGGGGGGSYINAGPSAGGVGGGGNGSGSPGPSATNASANMGGGGGGGFHPGGLNGAGSNGGSGIVMIRYKYQN
jgi:hypothetical protein